jgi:hypothetical protein
MNKYVLAVSTLTIFLVGVNAVAGDWEFRLERETAGNVKKCNAYWGPHIKEVEAAQEEIVHRKLKSWHPDVERAAQKLRSRLNVLNDALYYCYNNGLPYSKEEYSFLF